MEETPCEKCGQVIQNDEQAGETNVCSACARLLPPPLPPPLPLLFKEKEQWPVIRVTNRFFRREVIAFYETHLIYSCSSYFRPHITEEMCQPEGEAKLRQELRGGLRISFDEISRVREKGGPLKSKWHFALTKDYAYDITAYLKNGKQLRFKLDVGQANHPRAILTARLEGRYWQKERSMWGLAKWTKLTHGLPKATPIVAKSRRNRKSRNPVRFRPLGWLLKLLGVCYWIIIASPLTDGFADFVNAAGNKSNPIVQNLVWLFIWAPAPLLIWFGYRMCQRQYVSKGNKDSRTPILFLRPFADDVSTSLQPPGFLAGITGVRATGYPYDIYSPRQESGRVKLFDLVTLSHPSRLVRMLFDIGADSSKKCIVRCFRRYGPVIAIGRPGETLAAPGALRAYVPDDKWQETVRTELKRVQAVILQPGFSTGVHWELTEIRALVEPHRLLLCLVSYWRNPEAYETVCDLVRQTLRLDLPLRIPFLDRPAFIFFDHDWIPYVQELSYRCPALWPVVGDATDLRYTLQPFVQRMQGIEECEAPRRPRWQRGFSTKLAKTGACILSMVVLLLPIFAVKQASALIFPAWGAESEMNKIANGRRMELVGSSVPYAIDVPEVMTKFAPSNDMMEHFLTTPDNRMQFQIYASKGRWNLSNFAEKQLQAFSGNGYKSSRLEFVRSVSHAGVDWTEVSILYTLSNGVTGRKIERVSSTSRGSVLILFNYVYFAGEKDLYDNVIAEILSTYEWTSNP